MGDMSSSRRTEVSVKSAAQQLADHNIGTELTTAWKSMAQSKAALRHIENHIEAVPGTGVLLHSVMDPPKDKASRTVRCRDGQQANRGSSKRRGRSQQSPEKSSSRSPLRNTTQDSNVGRNHSVEFREPLVSYRGATPPPHPSSQLESFSLQSVPGSSYQSSDPLLSQLVYQRDTRDKQTDRDLDSTHSSALESTRVRYLNDQPALDTLKTNGIHSHLTDVNALLREGSEEESTPKAQFGMDSQHSSPCLGPAPGSVPRGESTPSSSPGSASQRLENLRRHQPDDKLEKLKERIRRQRQHLEEAAEREKMLGFLEQPIMAGVGTNKAGTNSMPTAKIRKVAAAPPAPIYKGFNSTETKIRTPDGKVWKEEEFLNLSRDVYRDLSRQDAESRMRHQQQREERADRSRERRPPKPTRKVHRAAPASDLNAKPVISPASWRDGQKLVKMVLGPVPQLPREHDRSRPVDGLSRTATHHHSSSNQRSKSSQRSRPNSTERLRGGFREQSKSPSASTSCPLSAAQDKPPAGVSTDLLSADIQGILDDLQLECKAAEKEERARQRSRGGSSGRRGRGGSGSRTRTPMSAWGTTAAAGSSSRGCRSASPTTHRPESANMTDAGHKKRHYDADAVRHYITRQQEERKRRQAEEKKALREETERRNQRLQELYRKQREVARTVAVPNDTPVAPVQKRLQETYNKLLLEEAQLGEDVTQMHPVAHSSQMRPMYQPSGESDKENKRLDAPHSPSSSDMSLNERPPPLSRDDLDVGISAFLQPEHLSSAFRHTARPSGSTLAPYGDHLFSQLLRLESEVAASNSRHTQRPVTAPSNRSQFKMSRIEALKATAASLSNRIESQARKIAGDGINYGAATSVDMDAILAPVTSRAYLDDGCWAETAATEDDDVALGVQRNTGHSSYDSTALPGVGNLHTLGGQKEKRNIQINLTSSQANYGDRMGPTLNSYAQERGKLVNGLEKVEIIDEMAIRSDYDKMKNQTDLHDSSAGSISEGPILSEGSFSEEEESPPRPSQGCASRPAGHLEAAECCAGQRKDYQRLFEFQREAAMCSALSPPLAQQDSSKMAWEELNKGSPLSVINIFTKNLHGHVKASERNSPSPQPYQSGNGLGDAPIYEDDFMSSSQSSRAPGQLRRGTKSPSVNSHFEELMRRSPYEKNRGGINSHHSSFHSSVHSPRLSSGSTSGSSPLSKYSSRRTGTSDQSDATLVEERRSPSSPQSEVLSSDSRKKGSDKSSAHSEVRSVHSSEPFGQSQQRSAQDGKVSASAVTPKHASPSGSPDRGSPPGADSFSEHVQAGSHNIGTGTSAGSGRAETRTTGELQYSPAVLQQRMAAELHYLESVEESVRQLGDMERLIGVSMAQQESANLAQMLKAKQQRHERDLYELKIKAEREALGTKLQLEENRHRVARAHTELQESMAANQKETLEGLQEATTKMMSQQAETAQYTADAARHIKEMTELARSQIAGALVVAPVPGDSSMLDQREQQESSYAKQQQDKADFDSFQSEVSSRRTKPDEPQSSLNSLSQSDSLSFRRPNLSEGNSSSLNSQSYISSDNREPPKKEAGEGKWRNGGAEGRTEREAGSSSIKEEVPTAANDSLCSDSIPSIMDEKGDSTSVATDYSLKFDESMTEDEIEERSFRSLLPSEAHRRETIEKKSRHHEESEDDGANHNMTLVSGAHKILKSQDANMAFSGGQDSFSQFTMDMVRQYMKDEEVRLQHQSSLLHLRQKALKEKTRTELAWLEHQKNRLRDKGEDDKMPPIRKRQRGLLMKLQQEQAEIKRLQEANKAARKERQLLLKQQEEIERMRNSTLRLKERLKCAGGESPPETPVSEPPLSVTGFPIMRHAHDNRSPSPPLSISGSETSSIMQKLKKMRTHMDEKFLTKREQQLMHRRRHAEELLQWKQRLDQEEAEVRRMEKEALAVWDKTRSQHKDRDVSESPKEEIPGTSPGHHQSSEPRTDSERDYVSEGDCSSATPESSIHTEGFGSQPPGSPSSAKPVSVPETPLASVQSSPANYTQDFTSASPSPGRQSVQSSVYKGSHSPAASPSDGSSKTKMQLHSSSRTIIQARTQPTDSPKAKQTEPISDQSDIETRIRALKEELRKRKFMACQLKKEQKKRNKERLKAKEASLLKQLETYNDFIEKTKAELDKEPDSTPDTRSQIQDSISEAKQSRVNPPSHSSEKSQDPERTKVDASFDHHAPAEVDHSRSTSLPEGLSDEDPPTVTPTPGYGSPESPRSRVSSVDPLRPTSNGTKAQIHESGEENILSDLRSEIQEELEMAVSSGSEDQLPERLLKLEKEDRPDSQEKQPTCKHDSSSLSEKHRSSPAEPEDVVKSLSATVDLKTKEVPKKDAEASSSLPDGYRDDFESSLDSSPREQQHISKPETQISVSPTEIKVSRKDSPGRAALYDSQDEEVEEEIAEELSHHSGTSEPSEHSGRLLELHKQTEDFKHDNRSINSSHSPPLSPGKDEMPSFQVGDRVLVGSVQPGTLRFKGPTSFANGFWAGVELDKSEGSNNGTYDGVAYFECNECHGIFAPPDKITHLPDKFGLYTDTTEDEDSFFDDLSDKGGDKCKRDEEGNDKKPRNLKDENEQTSHKDVESGNKKIADDSLCENQTSLKPASHLNSQHLSNHQLSNGNSQDIILEFDDAPTPLLISDMAKIDLEKEQSPKEIAAPVESEDVDSQHQFTPADLSTDIGQVEGKDTGKLDKFTDTLFNNFLSDTVKQFTELKRAKEQKIRAANQMNGELLGDNVEEEWIPSVEQKDGLPFFPTIEKEELSSPELCNRPESPVLGASGQEELAKRLAELELSRELLDDLGDDQDWFDEDYGLSSRREQQRLKQRQIEEEEELRLGGLGRPGSSAPIGGLVSSLGGEQQVKSPPRPELPLPLPPKLPEQPAMVVPHSAAEVEKMVHAAAQEIWESCGLGRGGGVTLSQLPKPQPSHEYLGKEATCQDQEALSIRSYKKGVFDLTWEILQEIHSEDPSAEQPQWVKARRVKASYHRVKSPGDITKVQEFLAAEVLKLYGLAKDHSQKTDWQKMLKFGKKKRDRVDHILVQELHEEEAQWVNYDEDELFVKMQLADSIFDTLLKDTANTLTQICDARAKRDGPS